MSYINRNSVSSKEYSSDSFIGKFHEDRVWDDDEYFLLENELYELCSKHQSSESIPREIAWPLMKMFSYLMISLSCQYDSNDGFKIENINRDQFCARRERLQLVFEGFFKGEMPNKEYLGY